MMSRRSLNDGRRTGVAACRTAREKVLTRYVLIALVFGLVGPAHSATIRVAKDGSGDYLIIQEAVDAAASGDTVLVGPGRYNEGQVVSTPGWTEFVRVLIHQDELTVIGSGADRTIVGPAGAYDAGVQGDDRGIYASPWFGNHRTRITDIGFENMWGGVVGMSAADLSISRCRFTRNAWGIICGGGADLSVDSSTFDELAVPWGMLLYTNSMNVVDVGECEFALDQSTDGARKAVQFDTTESVDFHDCNVLYGKYGLTFSGAVGSVAQVRDCRFVGQLVSGLSVIGLQADVTGCEFSGQRRAVYAYSPERPLSISGSIFRDVSECTFGIDWVGTMAVHDCVLARGAMYTFLELSNCEKSTGDLPHLDLTGNDWGTTDADSIASWIHACDYVVDYIPFVGQQVPTEKQSIGGLKSLFLGR